ncbi:MAG: hypothetical protein FWD75_03435 [Propionibacteriaceae bacterium]|nr:hypothetical protein [Propionibacteriaceae bacterium]
MTSPSIHDLPYTTNGRRALATRIAIAAIVMGVMAVLAGCGPAAGPTIETITLAHDQYSFTGNLVPEASHLVDVRPEDLAHTDGAWVSMGDELRAQTPAVLRALTDLQSRIEHHLAEQARASRAAKAVGKQAFSYSWPLDTAPGSGEIHTIGHAIQSALIADARAASAASRQTRDNQADLASLHAQLGAATACPTSPGGDVAGTPDPCTDAATLESLKQQIIDVERATRAVEADQYFARQETDNQLATLFGQLVEAYAQVIEADSASRDSYHVPSPADGRVEVRGHEVWVSSSAFTLVYTATQAQADSLTAASGLRVEQGGTTLADAQLRSTTFSAEATSDLKAPKYTMTFSLTPIQSGLDVRPQSTATLTYSSDTLVIPSAFLGTDGATQYVIQDGRRVSVTASKDLTGQWVVRPGVLQAGAEIERIGGR